MSDTMVQEPVREVKAKAKRSDRTSYNVLVRHSPFLLKQADVEADTPEEAKSAFLLLVKEHTEKVVKRQLGQAALQDGMSERPAKEAARVRATYTDGMARLHEMKFEIRTTAEVEAQRKAIKEQRGAADEKFQKLLDRLDVISKAAPVR